ncbi:DUF3179 domain-containing protein [Halobacteriaceae archaeon GCM10025711]
MQYHGSRRAFLATAASVAIAGCLGGQQAGDRAAVSGDGDVERAATGPPTASVALPVEYSFKTLTENVASGGPAKDGIPSIDDPEFVDVAAADENLAPGDVVFGVVRGDDVRAYPQNVLVWHEVVNDVLDGERVSVTYCPLTGTAMGFERGDTEFGVSGRLLNSNLVMYDRATDSRWPQVLATSIEGAFRGRSLREFRVVWTTWGRWRDAHPETAVLSEDSGFARNYDRDPYGSYNPTTGYYTSDGTLFGPLTDDDRFPTKAVVLGSRTADGAVAFHKPSLRDRGVMTGALAGTDHLAVYDPTLDTGYVYRNPDGVAFDYENGQAVGPDGTAHAPADLPLEPVLAFDAMWFAWAGFYPSTEVYA